MRRAVVALLVLALAGCLGGNARDGGASPPGASDPSAAAPAAPVETPVAPAAAPPPARLVDAGLAWSGCAFFDSVYYFGHEWADEVVPDDYRMDTVVADVGQSTLHLYRCDGLAIGNQTFLPGVMLGYYAILVDPPAEVDHPEGDYFVLDVFTSSPEAAAQMAEAGLPVHVATFTMSPDELSVTADAAAARVTVAHRTEANQNDTAPGRFHWQAGGRFCWSDVDHRYTTLGRSDSSMEGIAGNPATVSGPAHRLVGFSADGVEDGFLAPPTCRDAA